MYKWVLSGFVVICLAVLVTNEAIAYSLFAFLILGIIPGTDTRIPYWLYLFVLPSVIAIGLYWAKSQTLHIGETSRPPRPYLNKQRTARIAAFKRSAKKPKKAKTSPRGTLASQG